MRKYLILILGLLLLSSTIVLADQQLTIQTGTEHNFVVVCNNNGALCNSKMNGNVTIIAANQSILVNNQIMTNNSQGVYNYTLSSSQTGSLGDYLFIPTFYNIYGSFSTPLTFTVTPSGTIPSISEALIYIVMFFFVAFLTLASFIWAMNIEGANQYDDATKTLIDLNYGKYGRILLFGLSYTGLIVLSWLAWMISQNILWLGFATNILKVGFLVLTRVTYPLLFFIGIVIMARFINHDLKEKRLRKQGLGREHY